MDNLRLTLLLIGVVVISIIYLRYRSSDQSVLEQLSLLWSRIRKRLPEQLPVRNSGVEEEEIIPTLSPTNDEPDLRDFEQLAGLISSRYEKAPVDEQQRPIVIEDDEEEGSESLLFVIFLIANNNKKLNGSLIHETLLQSGMEFSESGVFDYLVEDRYGRTRPLFSIANALEPGVFDEEKLPELHTPGLVCILQLPGPMESRAAFDSMLQICQQLAASLDAELYDENRSVLRTQTISHFRDQLEQYRLRQKMSQRRNKSR